MWSPPIFLFGFLFVKQNVFGTFVQKKQYLFVHNASFPQGILRIFRAIIHYAHNTTGKSKKYTTKLLFKPRFSP